MDKLFVIIFFILFISSCLRRSHISTNLLSLSLSHSFVHKYIKVNTCKIKTVGLSIIYWTLSIYLNLNIAKTRALYAILYLNVVYNKG